MWKFLREKFFGKDAPKVIWSEEDNIFYLKKSPDMFDFNEKSLKRSLLKTPLMIQSEAEKMKEKTIKIGLKNVY